MSKVVVLGGCGGIGSVAARAVACGDWFDEVVLADLRGAEAAAAAAALQADLGRSGISGAGVDATDPTDLARLLEGATVAVSCIGPFYRFGAPVLAAAIDAGVAFVDVCDDLDATLAARARRRRSGCRRAGDHRHGQLAGAGQRVGPLRRRPPARRGHGGRHHAQPRRRARRGLAVVSTASTSPANDVRCSSTAS
ncbi:MAG: saccharopine dehydrogenase NADP-binding domain-containing protein [Acidimicrobiales bacterium]